MQASAQISSMCYKVMTAIRKLPMKEKQPQAMGATALKKVAAPFPLNLR